MRHGVLVTALAAALFLSGCAEDPPAAPPAAVEVDGGPPPAYDPTLEPAAAVLALVPEEARTLAVTDLGEVAVELGAERPRTAAEVEAFWARATAEQPVLTGGLLRGPEATVRASLGISQADVAWEARFAGADGQELGWVLRLRDGADVAAVAQATEAPGGALSEVRFDAERRLVSRGTTADPARSWAADRELVGRVSRPASSTWVHRGCVVGSTVPESEEFEELEAYAVQFEGSVVTARLGEGRRDLFTRMRAATADETFAAAFDGGVADPGSGRIGFVVTDPPRAAELALGERLPFAACP